MFLVKQGHHSIVCQLDLKGFDGELAVISGRASTVERLHRIMEETGPEPARGSSDSSERAVRRREQHCRLGPGSNSSGRERNETMVL